MNRQIAPLLLVVPLLFLLVLGVLLLHPAIAGSRARDLNDKSC